MTGRTINTPAACDPDAPSIASVLSDPRDLVAALVDIVGSQQSAAAMFGVTPAAVSAWMAGGILSEQSERMASVLWERWRLRRAFFGSFLRDRLATRRAPYISVVVEAVTSDAIAATATSTDSRTFIEAARGDSALVASRLAGGYLDWDLIVDGDVLIFFKPLLTHLVYVNLPFVCPALKASPWPTVRAISKASRSKAPRTRHNRPQPIGRKVGRR